MGKTEKIEDSLRLYYKTFDSIFPTIPLSYCYTDDEIIKIINKCVKAKKDVYDMGYLTLDLDTLY